MAQKKKMKKNNINNTEVHDKEPQKEELMDESFVEKNTNIEDTSTSLSIIDKEELNELIEEDLDEKKVVKKRNPFFVHFLLIILFFLSILSFGMVIIKDNSISLLINSLILTLFSIIFVVVSFTYNRNKKTMIGFGSLLLIVYFILNINNHFTIVNSPISTMPDFQGKMVTDVIKWANKNHISIHQEYEYSDMVDEYKVISQNVKYGTTLNKIDEVTISISEGANPSKEIMVPDMVSWDSERVLLFVRENYLSNVVVEFVESDKSKDTVIEQNTSGSLKRDDELKLTFSYGEELGFDEVKLIDFTNKSKFEVEFYMKQHQLRYEFLDDFSSKIKKGYAFKQNIKSGENVSIDDERVIITISKGPEIKVPDLLKLDVSKLTEWAIKNKLKLNFTDGYDDSIKENGIISANYKDGDIIEQGTIIKVVLSRGSLKMKSFKSLNDFYTWANKYNIKYEEEHEFSDTIPSGEVISYSYKKGDVIKNNDIIKVIISDGSKRTVPNLKGLTKKEAISKLEKAGLKYSFVYKNSSKEKDIVLNQSISSGSEISNGTTITITLSNGREEEKKEEQDDKKEDDEKTNFTPSNHSNNTEEKKEEEKKPEEKKCNTCPRISPAVISNAASSSNTCSEAQGKIKSDIQGQCPGISVTVKCLEKDGYRTNDFISGFRGGTSYNGETLTSCSSIEIVLAK